MSTRPLCIALVAGLVAAAPARGGDIMRIHSSAFEHGKKIPARYTCDGKDLSPPLAWGPLPPGTKRIAVVVEDPTVSAGSAVQWAIYDLPGTTKSLPEGVPRTEKLKSGAHQARNDFGTVGYRGPCPTAGTRHEYWFRVYALDGRLVLREKPKGRDVLRAIPGRALGVAEVMGSYSR
jgi:Raf kinase inhibitor-like YbhB/YbcL family protein